MFAWLVLVLVIFGISYLAFPFAVYTALRRSFPELRDQPLLLLGAMVLAPCLISWLLYLQLVLLGGLNASIYLLGVCLFFTALAVFGKGQVQQSVAQILKWINPITGDQQAFHFKTPFLEIASGKQRLNWTKLALLIVAVYFGWQWILKIFTIPLIGHDILEYAALAKDFADHRVIEYAQHRYNPLNEFYYVGLHGFGFQLLGTWEFLCYQLFGDGFSDVFFKSTAGYFGFLIVFTVYFVLKNLNVKYAYLPTLAMLLVYGLVLALKDYHIDSMRLALFLMSTIALALSVQQPKWSYLLLLGMFLGFQAFTHSFGVFISVFMALAYFLFCKANWQNRLKNAMLLGLLILVFGGVHYLLDVAIGTGWIFQSIKFY